MKIAIDGSFINSNYGGGKEQVLLNLLKGWEECGLSRDIVIFCGQEAASKLSAIAPGITCIVIKTLDYRFKFKCLVFRTLLLPLLVKKYGIDLLVFPVAYTGLAQYKIPTVVMPHDIQSRVNPHKSRSLRSMLYNIFYWIDFRNRDHIVSISDFDRDQIEKHFKAYKHKIKRIYNPIDISTEAVADKNSCASYDYIFANNLSYAHKNLKTLLKAFARIRGAIRHKLVLAGNLLVMDDEEQALIELLKREDRLEVLGYIEQEHFWRVLTQARLFVNPSFFEGFGMSAVEAMLAGVPCVLADNSAVREVTLGRCEYYEPAGDDEILAGTILDALRKNKDDSYLRQSRQMMADRYHYRKISKQYADFFKVIAG